MVPRVSAIKGVDCIHARIFFSLFGHLETVIFTGKVYLKIALFVNKLLHEVGCSGRWASDGDN